MPGVKDIAGILLAGGLGRRFDPEGSRLKLLEPAPSGNGRGLPLAVAACRNLRAAVGVVYAVVRADETPSQQRLQRLLRDEGCWIVATSGTARGMGASLACGVEASAGHAGWVVALADMPAVHPRTIAGVADAVRAGALIAAPYYGDRRGHPVGFGAALFDELASLDGDVGARALLQRHPVQRIAVDDPGCLVDIDLQDDLSGGLVPPRHD